MEDGSPVVKNERDRKLDDESEQSTSVHDRPESVVRLPDGHLFRVPLYLDDDYRENAPHFIDKNDRSVQSTTYGSSYGRTDFIKDRPLWT